MLINFRQGVISPTSNFLTYTGTGVSISVTPSTPVQVAVAHLDTNYLWEEDANITNAWTNINSPSVQLWLYWDFNLQTFDRTFGYTNLLPVVGATPPANPQNGQMWYDTATFQNFYFLNGSWIQCLRVFAAQFNGGQFISMGNGGVDFVGSQIGNNTANSPTGRPLFDQTDRAIHRQDTTFLTSEDVFYAFGTRLDGIRLEANVIEALCDDTAIAQYNTVAFQSNGGVSSAQYEEVGTTVIGIATQNMFFGQLGGIIVQGAVNNPSWNWLAMTHAGSGLPVLVGQPLWVQNGGLTPDDPHLTDPVHNPIATVPVARIINTSTVIFEQGLGGLGPQGPPGTFAGIAINLVSNSSALVITGSPLNAAGTGTFTLSAELEALSLLSATGFVVRTGSATYTERTLTAGSNVVSITNGNGVSANPVIDVVQGNILLQNLGGTLGIPQGGTGQVTANAAFNALAPNQAGLNNTWFLNTNGTNTAWSQISLTSQVQGVLPITSGGTGNTSALAAFNALSPLTTVGDILAFNGVNNVRVPNGTPGQVLTATGTIPNWTTPNTGTVTSVGASGSTGLTIGGTNPVTTSGTITFTLSSNLQGLSGLSGPGFAALNGGTWTTHTFSNSDGFLTVTNGNGASAGNVVININSSNPIPPTGGGTGLSTAPTTGQILIGIGSGNYGLRTLTAGTGISIVTGPSLTTVSVVPTNFEYIFQTSLHGGPLNSYLINHNLNQQFVDVECYTFTPTTPVLPVTGTTTNTFAVSGDHSGVFLNGVDFAVIGSTGNTNDGTWTTVSSLYNGVSTVITVTNTVTTGLAANGSIYVGPSEIVPMSVFLIDANNCVVTFSGSLNAYIVVTGTQGVSPA